MASILNYVCDIRPLLAIWLDHLPATVVHRVWSVSACHAPIYFQYTGYWHYRSIGQEGLMFLDNKNSIAFSISQRSEKSIKRLCNFTHKILLKTLLRFSQQVYNENLTRTVCHLYTIRKILIVLIKVSNGGDFS